MTLTTTVSGNKYKFNIDRDGNGLRNDGSGWSASPANPHREQTRTRNSIVP